jgi:hypothetical protein
MCYIYGWRISKLLAQLFYEFTTFRFDLILETHHYFNHIIIILFIVQIILGIVVACLFKCVIKHTDYIPWRKQCDLLVVQRYMLAL